MSNRFDIDLSDLVVAIQANDQGRLNRLLTDVVPILVDYLRVRMQASTHDAEDSVHTALADTIERVRREGVRNEKAFYVYLLRAVKHEYLKVVRSHKHFSSQELQDENLPRRPEQFDNILEKERKRLLRDCLNQLNEESRIFIEFCLKHPEMSNQEIADAMDVSHANARVKKMRIIRILHECYERKSSR